MSTPEKIPGACFAGSDQVQKEDSNLIQRVFRMLISINSEQKIRTKPVALIINFFVGYYLRRR